MTFEELLAENQRLRERVQALEQENALLRAQYAPVLSEPEPSRYGIGRKKALTEEEKEAELQRRVSIFRNLFKGREDVFAQRFVSTSGKQGYQPVCKNRWSTICQEHRRKCEGCPAREFVPLEDSVIRNHLSGPDKLGKDVIGLYPILEDNTVFFLCADFDDKNCEHGYKDDVLSYVRVCKEWGIPAYIERSRSGNGAHVWIFFSDAIPASKARKLGFSILRAAMEDNVRIDMKSYDRFFPNQDFLPKGGFGNLVALPLQGMARRNGNSIFVDKTFTPYQDQWALLSSISKLSEGEISTILERHNLRLDLSSSTESKPWEIPKPDKISFEDFDGPITLVRANGIYMPIRNVSGKVIRHLKELASFRNPKYYELLNARKPLFNTPSIVSCSEMNRVPSE